MFCEQCGKELRSDAKFCENCGAKISLKEEVMPNITSSQESYGVTAPPPLPELSGVTAPARTTVAPPLPPPSYSSTTGVGNSNGKQVDYLMKPMSVGSYMLFYIIMIIPLVNLIMLFVWSFGSEVNINKKNLARACLIYLAIGVLCLVFFYGSMLSILNNFK